MNILTTKKLRRLAASFIILWLSIATPTISFAQEAIDATGAPTGAPADTGAPANTGTPIEKTGASACTGAGCGQGTNQGVNQGAGQGGTTVSDLGGTYDDQGKVVLPSGVTDTRQGATQGSTQGTSNGITGTNTDTGANSNNTAGVSTDSSNTTGVTNKAATSTQATAVATTGQNANSTNTGGVGIKTGNANISGTQIINDNTAVIGGSAGLNTIDHQGDYLGNLLLGFGAGTAKLSNGSSILAVNDNTGANSNNDVDIATRVTELNEVQNDGKIDNILDLAAITGQNKANKNTGDADITTGDANVAATLVNLLNSTVINGDLWLSVANIFGNLEGDIYLPDLAGLFGAGRNNLAIDATNDMTGENSDNTIDININDTEKTIINNDADINTEFNVEAITGQNNANMNTGGGSVDTGNANVAGSSISLANTTVEGGNWALVIVNALNGWLGFLVGDNGSVQALSQQETLNRIDGQNSNTGADSTNEIKIDVDRDRTSIVKNDAQINNQVNASAITGQNEAQKNTGNASITTGKANVQATAVNIANTTVKDGSLAIAIVNVFGDWLGDIFYGGNSLQAAAGGGGRSIDINAGNQNTGAISNNTIDIAANKNQETDIHNDADINTILNANVDTGNNSANQNTGAGDITTGEGLLALHSRNVANITAIADDTGLTVDIAGLNDTTGFDSTNKIKAKINDERIITIDNLANISTIIGSLQLPSLVNTGHNTANQNTGGANIQTGNATADVIIQNMVNRVIAALTGGGIAVDANFANQLTGALSLNINDLKLDQNLLLTILNDATIDNILNLLLNTGNNTANKNTGGGDGLVSAAVGGGTGVGISTGGGCVSGGINNSVNTNSLTASGVSLNVSNNAVVNNIADIGVNTGQNQAVGNTSGASITNSGTCQANVAQAPSPSPTPTVVSNESNVGSDGQGGDGETAEKKIAAAVTKRVGKTSGTRLMRFPVAGTEGIAELMQGKRHFSLSHLMVLLATLVGLAWHFDRQARTRGNLVKSSAIV